MTMERELKNFKNYLKRKKIFINGLSLGLEEIEFSSDHLPHNQIMVKNLIEDYLNGINGKENETIIRIKHIVNTKPHKFYLNRLIYNPRSER